LIRVKRLRPRVNFNISGCLRPSRDFPWYIVFCCGVLRLKIVFTVLDTPAQGVLFTAKCRGGIIYTDNIILPGNDYIVSIILL
jgi:hypothetical protein